jgi:hypothetical protein
LHRPLARLNILLSITALEQNQRNDNLQKLSNNTWCSQRIAELFPDFPVIARIEKVTNTAEKLQEGIRPNIAKIVVWTVGYQSEYYKLFLVYQREPDPLQLDPTNHYHIGFITSDLEIFDLGIDVMLQ